MIRVIKLMETGLLNALSKHWLEQKTGFSGLIALIIFIIENIVFIYKTRYS